MKIELRNFTKRFDGQAVVDNVSLTIESGEMIALLGPSGCGKSTSLFSICGIHRMDEGQLLFGDKDVTNLPSQKRNVGVVFQNYALYPHMSIFENIAFPLVVQKADRATIRRKVADIAELVQISDLLERKPANISGGQQQRTALARALIRRPDVLLLDEPLANLDAKLRLEMRSEIRRIQSETGITAILVTHDQVEAMSICDRIALMQKGKVVQLDKPREMYANPANMFVAEFLGNPPIRFMPAELHENQMIAGGAALPRPQHLKQSNLPDKINLGIRPEHFGPQFGNEISGHILAIETQGRENLYDVALSDGGVLCSIQPANDHLNPGDTVQWGIASQHLLAFDGQGERI